MSYEEQSRLAELKNNISNISPIKSSGHAHGSSLVKSGKASELSEPKSESNISSPDLDNFDNSDGPVKGFSTEDGQGMRLKEPLSSSSLQEDIELIDSQEGSQRTAGKVDESLEEMLNELQTLVNAEEYISHHVSKDKSFDLEVEFEMNHIHKEKISKKLEELIVAISRPPWSMLCQLIFQKLPIIDLYKLRACVECEELKKLSQPERRLINTFKFKLSKKIEEMD